MNPILEHIHAYITRKMQSGVMTILLRDKISTHPLWRGRVASAVHDRGAEAMWHMVGEVS